MREFRGSYLGITPTDESAIAAGEIEMLIGEQAITIRIATGLKLFEETVPLSMFRPMSQEEVCPNGQGADSPREYRGFTTKDGEGIHIIFTRNPKLIDFDVFIRMGEMADLLGPTILWSRRRIFRIILLRLTLAYASWKTKGGVPRLAYDGRRKQNRHE